MKRSLKNIVPVITSHAVGEKRVLLAREEAGCDLTQIAVTDLKAGEVALAHIHPDMQEGFYVLEGELEVTLSGDGTEKQHVEVCHKDDFMYVESGTAHELHALTDVRVMTIGCEIESKRNLIYPFVFKPNLHPVIWGGHRLKPWKKINDPQALQDPQSPQDPLLSPLKGEDSTLKDTQQEVHRKEDTAGIESTNKDTQQEVLRKEDTAGIESTNKDTQQEVLPLREDLGGSSIPIGESWEVSAVPSSPSIIDTGYWTGKSLIEVINQMPTEILGRSVAKRYGNKLPLLVKFIDAEKDLSIQVHPDDRMAKREHNKFGKTEMWYVIDAKPGAYLYAGFKEELTPEEYARKVADGTIVDSLAKHEVHTGDVFYIPAGRVHAICSGILLAEVQQSSDVTYRIYDYDRPGMDGKPRELHTQLAAQALDYQVHDEYRTDYVVRESASSRVIDSPYFNVRVVDIDQCFHRNLVKYDSFVITMCLKGSCHIRIRSTQDEVVLHEGNSCLIPAAIADYDIEPINGHSLLLDAFIDNLNNNTAGEDGLLSKLSRFLHITGR